MFFVNSKKISDIIKTSSEILYGYKSRIAILVTLNFFGTILESIGINAVIPLLSFLTGGSHGDDFISKSIKQLFQFLHIDFSLKQLLIFICILFTMKAIFSVLNNYLQGIILADYEEKTRNKLYESTIKANWLYLINQKLGHLDVMLKNSIGRCASLLRRISITISIIFSLFVYTAVAINISLQTTLITLALGLIIFIFLKPIIRKGRQYAQKEEALFMESAHFINENAIGLKTIKATLVENEIFKKSRNIFAKFKKIKIRMYLLSALSSSIIQPISIIFICAIFAFSYKMPNFNLAKIVVIIFLIQKIFQYIQSLQANFHAINELTPYAKNIMIYTKKTEQNIEKNQYKDKFNFNNQLTFKKIKFEYEINKPILNNINFTIKKGEMVGLIGSSGAGKTTVVDLILRLFQPISGSIKVDGKNINKIDLRSWRKNIGYISQDMFLINDTIENNIKFYNNSITKNDIIKATKMANIYNTIIDLTDKFNTVIGERGIMLSAGQRQRIIIARVLATNPNFLIMDEATSALDNESEIKIQKVIDGLRGKITTFVIAHRLSTIMNSDKILVIDNGTITEKGAPKKLLEDKGTYFYKMYNIRK